MTDQEMAESFDEISMALYEEGYPFDDDIPFDEGSIAEDVVIVNGEGVTESTWKFSEKSTCGFCGTKIPFSMADQVETIDGSPACVSCFCQLNAL